MVMPRLPFLVGAAVLSLAGCQTTKGPAETTLQAAMAKMPEQCPLRADFPVPVFEVDHSDPKMNGPGAFDYAVAAAENGNAFITRCNCGDALDMSRIDALGAKAVRRAMVNVDGWTLQDLKFFDDGLTKRSDDISYRDDGTGSRVRKAITHYGGHCVQSIEGAGLKTDLARVDVFIQTIRNARMSQPPLVQQPPAAPQTVAR